MPRVGFKKTFNTAVADIHLALFALLRQYCLNAGFNVIIRSETSFELMPHGLNPADHTGDDTPHWHFSTYGGTACWAECVYGLSATDADARLSDAANIYRAYSGAYAYTDGSQGMTTINDPDVTLYFAADGQAGWWWSLISGKRSVWPDYAPVTEAVRGMACGARIERLTGDMTQGIMARYYVMNDWNGFQIPYSTMTDGAITTYTEVYGWSPLGGFTWNRNTLRATDSPLGRCVAPIYPAIDNQESVVMCGEYADILVATDGFAFGDTDIPGWFRAGFDAEAGKPMLMFRHPGAFTLEP